MAHPQARAAVVARRDQHQTPRPSARSPPSRRPRSARPQAPAQRTRTPTAPARQARQPHLLVRPAATAAWPWHAPASARPTRPPRRDSGGPGRSSRVRRHRARGGPPQDAACRRPFPWHLPAHRATGSRPAGKTADHDQRPRSSRPEKPATDPPTAGRPVGRPPHRPTRSPRSHRRRQDSRRRRQATPPGCHAARRRPAADDRALRTRLPPSPVPRDTGPNHPRHASPYGHLQRFVYARILYARSVSVNDRHKTPRSQTDRELFPPPATTPSTLDLTVSNAESVRGWPGPESRRC